MKQRLTTMMLAIMLLLVSASDMLAQSVGERLKA